MGMMVLSSFTVASGPSARLHFDKLKLDRLTTLLHWPQLTAQHTTQHTRNTTHTLLPNIPSMTHNL